MTSHRMFTDVGRLPAAHHHLIVMTTGVILAVTGFCEAEVEPEPRAVVVNSLLDEATPPAGAETLRSALAKVSHNGTITFDGALDGATIPLTIVADEHTELFGETFPQGVFGGYAERDYGRSALVVRKNVTIDASSLPHGITLAWNGGTANRARVLAVLGDLTMDKVTVRSGFAEAAATGDAVQPWTLARGGGLAIWGIATLRDCVFTDNHVAGDPNASRDRGAFGGAIYGDCLLLEDCVIVGNSAKGYGAAGGGVYSVGGAHAAESSALSRSVISGNRVTAEHSYGGGVYSDGGGPGNGNLISVSNCTLARNHVEDNPDIAAVPGGQFYYRGGGFYMSNGSLALSNCTVVENSVAGNPAVFNGRPNMGGGALAATIGDAHTVEEMRIGHSIITGNTLNGAASDIFTGSLVHFTSDGHNLVGALDFSQILVPIPPWWSLSRKHWPKPGDRDQVPLAEALDLTDAYSDATLVSAGADAGQPAVLFYPPGPAAREQIPAAPRKVTLVLAQYAVRRDQQDAFLPAVISHLRNHHKKQLGTDFGSGFGNVAGIPFVATAETWPRDPANAQWIRFWRDLETAINGRLGTAGLNDDFWTSFRKPNKNAGVTFSLQILKRSVQLAETDQNGDRRPAGRRGDIGAIER